MLVSTMMYVTISLDNSRNINNIQPQQKTKRPSRTGTGSLCMKYMYTRSGRSRRCARNWAEKSPSQNM